jgi:hypothetical protein
MAAVLELTRITAYATRVPDGDETGFNVLNHPTRTCFEMPLLAGRHRHLGRGYMFRIRR